MSDGLACWWLAPPDRHLDGVDNELGADVIGDRPADGSSAERVEDLAAVAEALNGRPRKTLDWKTPAEAIDDVLRSGQHGSVATTP